MNYPDQQKGKEGFKPISNTPPDTFINKLKFRARLILDLQINTIYHHLHQHLPSFRGKVLDIGCGQSPYKRLLDGEKTQYFGIDIEQAAENFDYDNSDITHFDGQHIPFPDNSMDCLICTEVLEHSSNPQQLVDEMYRVLKNDGIGILTVPWSARYHYIPYDYYRYTPSSLANLFQNFSIKIVPRGTDITVIVSKIIVAYFRALTSFKNIFLWLIQLLLCLIFMPILLVGIIIAHLSLIFDLGSRDDPLGYTLLLRK